MNTSYKKFKNRQKLKVNTQRRGFLKRSLSLTALLSLGTLPLVRPVLAAGEAPKRAIFVYVPDGCIPSKWHATGSEFSFALNDMTSPLEPVKDNCVFLDGLSMIGGENSHEGVKTILTGDGPVSLDVYLSERIGAATPHSMLNLGVASNFQGNKGVSYLPGGTPLRAEDNPLNVFKRLFGNSSGVGGGNVDQAVLLKRSILDNSLAEINSLRTRLGNEEKNKLDRHLSSLREVESRLSSGTGVSCNTSSFNQEGFTVSPNQGYPAIYEQNENFELVGKLQMDQIALALSCDMTRVVTLMFSHPVSPTKIPKLAISSSHHDTSHYGDPNSANALNFVKNKQFEMEQFAYLIQTLKNTPDVEGSVLDNSVIFLCSELGDSNLHDHKRMPFILAGGAGGDLRTGRALDFNGDAHSKLLVSIAQTMGQNINTFGYSGNGAGPLPGLFG